MSRQEYAHVQVLLPETKSMEAAGKTKREIAEHFGLRDKRKQLQAVDLVGVGNLLERYAWLTF